MVTEPLYVHRSGRELPTQLGIDDDELVGGLRRLVETVHQAVSVPYKEEFADLIRYQQVYVERNGVDVRLNTEVMPELVAAEAPDVVVLATGAEPIVPPFPGLEATCWLTAYDLLDGKAVVTTHSTFIVGAGTAGLETAEYLAQRGIKSTVVKRKPEVAGKLDPLAQAVLLRRLERLGVDVRTGVEVVGFETDEAGQTNVIARPYPHRADAQEMRFPVETVIIALGLRANRALAETLNSEAGLAVHVVGDCVEPREALEAVWEGFEAGRML